MGNKVSKISFNGQTIDINDPDAIEAQGSSEIPTILAHNTSEWQAMAIPAAIELQDELNGQPDRPISVEAVRKEFNVVKKLITNEDDDDVVYVDYFYDTSNNKVSARASNKNGYEIEIKDKLDILVFSLKSSYNSTTQTYAFDHYLGKITINTANVVYNQHYFGGEITIPNSEQDRVLYFVILNPVGVSGQYRVSKNNFISANNTLNTITLSSSDGSDKSSIVNALFSTPLTANMKVRFTISDGRFGELVTTQDFTINSGQSSLSVTLDPSGYKRTVVFEILEDGNNPIYNVINNNLIVNPRINTRIILLHTNPYIDGALVQILDGNSQYVQNKITRNCKYSNDFRIASDFNTEFPLELKIYSHQLSDFIQLDGAGQDDVTIQAIVDEDFPHAFDNNILFEGNNIYYFNYLNIGVGEEFEITKILGFNVDIDPANFNFKYFVDESSDEEYTQYEIWFVTKDGYLQSCYKPLVYQND